MRSGRSEFVSNVPLSGNSGKSAATVKGHILKPVNRRRPLACRVDGGYFAAMGFSLREGRFLIADDSRRAGLVCVISMGTSLPYY